MGCDDRIDRFVPVGVRRHPITRAPNARAVMATA